MSINIHLFKSRLEEEQKLLVEQLKTVGTHNPDNPEDWELKETDLDIMQSDTNEIADRSEELQQNQAILDDLETRYRSIVRALKKIEEGTYGICEIQGEAIEADRLEANPAARTCKAHMEEEGGLPL